uniref:Uncharacterized protein n=1 Tax=Chromera velia CCMP2878 TaxID=1169474 RepID=A0A0G4F4R9_9ALVE|eukprot:Cvel_161.t1-p1 / transcript=Cvel_161.t1 / gene=Cvel_161 / organism=Chromera_velia_CCMP2878 / gene_product=Probable E3 ubiquitin-protein ligase HERC3, putative / transcript_product=Probable E3 ubiquitin-protein ligase HERC3, putative / location=Cvel_scaffold10:107984-111938(-) / protein_length=694 / sequence_SO=supercontig / SO=protein_coding / is_pseudo=false
MAAPDSKKFLRTVTPFYSVNGKGSLAEGGQLVLEVAIGDEHGILLTDEGVVYTWGRNRYGQLGRMASRNENQALPVDKLFSHLIRQVSAGRNHCLVAAYDGTAFSWGRNKSGQVGGKDYKDVEEPIQIEFPHKEITKGDKKEDVNVAYVACGPHSSACLSTHGSIYVWGTLALQRGAPSARFPLKVATHENPEIPLPHKEMAISSEDLLGRLRPRHVSISENAYAWWPGEQLMPREELITQSAQKGNSEAKKAEESQHLIRALEDERNKLLQENSEMRKKVADLQKQAGSAALARSYTQMHKGQHQQQTKGGASSVGSPPGVGVGVGGVPEKDERDELKDTFDEHLTVHERKLRQRSRAEWRRRKYEDVTSKLKNDIETKNELIAANRARQEEILHELQVLDERKATDDLKNDKVVRKLGELRSVDPDTQKEQRKLETQIADFQTFADALRNSMEETNLQQRDELNKNRIAVAQEVERLEGEKEEARKWLLMFAEFEEQRLNAGSHAAAQISRIISFAHDCISRLQRTSLEDLAAVGNFTGIRDAFFTSERGIQMCVADFKDEVARVDLREAEVLLSVVEYASALRQQLNAVTFQQFCRVDEDMDLFFSEAARTDLGNVAPVKPWTLPSAPRWEREERDGKATGGAGDGAETGVESTPASPSRHAAGGAASSSKGAAVRGPFGRSVDRRSSRMN